ncbi:Abi family protein [Massilia oculi]|uniref:Abi family protein n=1 Tax=Massilia oculi TaxID=945844 RepID=UPI001AAF0ADC|nr:Abi family protein [Massilia oculi]
MFTTSELHDLQLVTSTARLSSYPQYLGTTNASEAYGAYMWSMAVSTAFSPIIHAVEVSFRNVLNNELSSHYGNDWFNKWVTSDANALRANGKIAVNQKSTGEKLIADSIKKITKRDYPNGAPPGYKPSWQRVLAEMSFGFWVTFLVKRFWDVNHKTKLWPNHTTAVFPGAPTSMGAVGALHTAFSEMVDIRNRIHHHEPLWKHSTVNSSSDALIYLNNQLTSALTKLDYLGRSQRSALEKYGVIASIKEICTQSAFDRFTGRSLGSATTYKMAKKDLRLLRKDTKDNDCVWVTSESGDAVQLIIRTGNRRFF